jgi:fumarate hydratase class I
MDPIDMHELIARGPSDQHRKAAHRALQQGQPLGIGAQGLGGLTTVLDVKILDFPTHAANLPVAMIPNCAATRHAHIVLDGSGPVALDPPSLDPGPSSSYDVSERPPRQPRHRHPRRGRTWKPGEVCCSAASCSPAATPPTSA